MTVSRPGPSARSRRPLRPPPPVDYDCSYSDPSLSLSSVYLLFHPAACISFIWLSTARAHTHISYAMLSLQFIWSIEVWSVASPAYARSDRKKRIQWCDMFPLFMHIIFVLLVGGFFFGSTSSVGCHGMVLTHSVLEHMNMASKHFNIVIKHFFARETINKSHTTNNRNQYVSQRALVCVCVYAL